MGRHARYAGTVAAVFGLLGWWLFGGGGLGLIMAQILPPPTQAVSALTLNLPEIIATPEIFPFSSAIPQDGKFETQDGIKVHFILVDTTQNMGTLVIDWGNGEAVAQNYPLNQEFKIGAFSKFIIQLDNATNTWQLIYSHK